MNIFYILLVVSIIILIPLFFRQLALSIREYRKANEDRVFSVEKGAFRITEIILQTGKLYTDSAQYTRPATRKSVTIGSLFGIGLHFMNEYVNPVKRVMKKLEPEIRETLLVLQAAGENAQKHGSKEAMMYVEECIGEAQSIFSDLESSGSVSDIKKKLEQMKSDAQTIADAETFDDAGSYDDSDENEDPGNKKKETYYEILGVEKIATEKEIKNAYHELAKKYHSDKFASAADDVKAYAEERFKDINGAYEVLSDSEKRKQYDQTIS